MRGKAPRLLIFLQALFLSTFTSQATQSKGSVDPLIERLSAQKLEPLGWLKTSSKEVRDKPLSPVPVSSSIVKTTHNLDSKHKAYASSQGVKSMRISGRAAPFMKEQINQLNVEQANYSPSQSQASILQPQPKKQSDYDVRESSSHSNSVDELYDYLYKPRGSKSFKLKDDLISKTESQRDVDVPRHEGVVETHSHIVVLGKSLSSNASSNCTSSQGYPNQSDRETNIHCEKTNNTSNGNSSSARKSPRRKSHRTKDPTISEANPSVSRRGVAGMVNATIPVIIPNNPVLPAPPKIPSEPARDQGGGTTAQSPWMCDKAYNPTLAGCVNFESYQ